MGLYRRGRTWWFSLTYGGVQIRRSTCVSDKRAAEEIYHHVMSKVREGKWFERNEGEGKTVRDLMERYIDEHSVPNKSPGTVRNDRGMVNEILQFFGDMLLEELTPPRIAEYKAFCRQKGLKPATINHRRKIMSGAFNLAINEWQWVKENPVQKVKAEKVRNERDRWLTLEEEQMLLEKSILHPTLKENKTEPRYWLQELIIFAIQTGMRQDEILSLKWMYVDLERKSVIVAKSKNGERRALPLNPIAYDLLVSKGQNRKSDYVFPNEAGRKILRRNLMRAFEKAVERAGLVDFTFHDLRHTFATRLAQRGVDLYTISKLLGHKDIRMTQRYAHHCTASLRRGLEAMEMSITNLSQPNEKGLQPSP